MDKKNTVLNGAFNAMKFIKALLNKIENISDDVTWVEVLSSYSDSDLENRFTDIGSLDSIALGIGAELLTEYQRRNDLKNVSDSIVEPIKSAHFTSELVS